MKLPEILNPWSEIRRLNRIGEEWAAAYHKLQNDYWQIEREAHFRNPETGRLGAKGQRFPRKD